MRWSSSSPSSRTSLRRVASKMQKRTGFEADDFLASAAHKEESRGGTVLIASGDRDTFQLASDRTTILYPVRGQGMVRIGPSEVRARYGVDPTQVPDFIALRGDPSDKIPGSARGAAQPVRRLCSTATVPLTQRLKAGRFPSQAKTAALPFNRDNGSQGSAEAPARSEASLEQSSCSRA